jgi:hypothetical protein
MLFHRLNSERAALRRAEHSPLILGRRLPRTNQENWVPLELYYYSKDRRKTGKEEERGEESASCLALLRHLLPSRDELTDRSELESEGVKLQKERKMNGWLGSCVVKCPRIARRRSSAAAPPRSSAEMILPTSVARLRRHC